jgi:hypothetical protein
MFLKLLQWQEEGAVVTMNGRVVSGPSPYRDEERAKDMIIVHQRGIRSTTRALCHSSFDHFAHLRLHSSKEEEKHRASCVQVTSSKESAKAVPDTAKTKCVEIVFSNGIRTA